MVAEIQAVKECIKIWEIRVSGRGQPSPDPDLARARIPRRRRYCSPATTGKEAAAGDEGTGGRGGGCRGGAGVEAV